MGEAIERIFIYGRGRSGITANNFERKWFELEDFYCTVFVFCYDLAIVNIEPSPLPADGDGLYQYMIFY